MEKLFAAKLRLLLLLYTEKQSPSRVYKNFPVQNAFFHLFFPFLALYFAKKYW